MREGRAAEMEHARLERRRTLGRYGLIEGARRYAVSLRCRALGITGIVDEVIDSPSGPVPVDVKFTEGRVAFGHQVQLAVYAMALEENLVVRFRAASFTWFPGVEWSLSPSTKSSAPPRATSLGACADREYRCFPGAC